MEYYYHSNLPPYRQIGHYTNRHKILLVGEGDFSFASCLATAFGTAPSLTATSLDSRGKVVEMYSNGEMNLRDLEARGATVVHRVNVRGMDRHPRLRTSAYDRIVFNFPHAGRGHGRLKEYDLYQIRCHQQVVSQFFDASALMLTRTGEIHVTHKTTPPYDSWNIVELAEDAGLALVRKVKFNRCDYPGYVNRKGFGLKWKTFPVGEASTFMFSKS